jgi:DNA repair exonuclease SbcCD ATPase subunit
MRYILAYFALMIGLSGLSLLAAGRALGFLLVLVAALLVYVLIRMEQARRRERRYGGYDAAIDGYEKRFTDAERALDERLPDDALDSPAMLELLSAYEDDPDDAEAVRRLYSQLRRRFRDWQEKFESLHAQNETGAFGLPEEFAARYAELDRRLTQLLADVRQLDARAEQMREITDDPLDKIAEGALKLEQAKATCARRFGNTIPEALRSKLALAAEKLADARAALAAGAERPLDAARLAQEVCALARAVEAASA